MERVSSLLFAHASAGFGSLSGMLAVGWVGVLAASTRGRELAELVAYHLGDDLHGDEVLAVVDVEAYSA